MENDMPTKETLENIGFSQPICKSRNDNEIVRYMKAGEVTNDFLDAWINNKIWGVYCDDNGKTIVELYDGTTEAYSLD